MIILLKCGFCNVVIQTLQNAVYNIWVNPVYSHIRPQNTRRKSFPTAAPFRRLSSEFSHVIFRGLKAEMPRFAARFSCGDIVRNASRFAIYDLQYNAQNKINEHHIANNCGNTCVFHRYTITFAATTSRNASRVRRSGGAFQPIAVYLLTSEQCALYAVMLNT